MKHLISTALMASFLLPVSMALPVGEAQARHHRHNEYREWQGRDGRTYCRKSDGITGLVVGAVGGALLGRTIDTRGDRTMGTVLGAAAGGVLGREIDRGGDRRRCR